jgi:hypothetical protein
VASPVERHAIAEPAQPLPRTLESLGIAVDRDETDGRMALQERVGMSAQPHRRVDENAVRAIGLEELEDLL